MMGRTIDNEINKFIEEIINSEVLQLSEDNKYKYRLYCSLFYEETKACFDKNKVNLKARQEILVSVIRFAVNLESVCARAFSPLSGSMSISEELKKMNNKFVVQHLNISRK